jgi:hypothetical protein
MADTGRPDDHAPTRAMRRALLAHERAILTHEEAEALFERHGRLDQAAREREAAERERERRDEAIQKLATLERDLDGRAPGAS